MRIDFAAAQDGIDGPAPLTEPDVLRTARIADDLLISAFAIGAPFGIYITTPDGECVFVNQAWSTLTGLAPEAAHGAGWVQALHPEDRAAVFQKWHDNTREHLPFQMEYRYLRPDGAVRWVLCKASAVLGTDGEVAAYIGMVLDYTARRAALEQLRESEERFERVSNTAPVILWVSGVDGCIEFINACGRAFLGLETGGGEAIAQALREQLEAATFCADLARAAATQSALSGVYQLRRADGLLRYMHCEASPRTDSAGLLTGFVGSLTDITPVREAEEHRRALLAREQRQQLNESLAALTAGIAHEFNNILTGILGYTGLAQHQSPADSPVREHLDRIEESTKRATALTRKMMAYSGLGRTSSAPICVSQLTRETISFLKVSIPNSITVSSALAEKLPEVSADSAQFGQVLVSLFSNAIEAIGESKGKVTVSTGVRSWSTETIAELPFGFEAAGGDYVFVSVCDDGCGMDAITASRIFEPFFTTKFTGRGMGLSAVQGIVQAHGGFFEVQSTPGQGSCITAYLPPCRVASTRPESPQRNQPFFELRKGGADLSQMAF